MSYNAECKRFYAQMHEEIREYVSNRLEEALWCEVMLWLKREKHERRASKKRGRGKAKCAKCGTQARNRFSRNGYRRREVVSSYGVLHIQLPRVRCMCGGSVQIPFSLLKPYQRFWEDVREEIVRYATVGMSLRQMQEELGCRLKTQVGLRKLNTCLHDQRQAAKIEFTAVLPVLMLDAIWLTQLTPSEVIFPLSSNTNPVFEIWFAAL